MGEADERLQAGPRGAAGERGAQGKQGERGERGLSRLQGRAVVFLFALTVVLSGYSLLWNSHQVNANAAAQRQQQASQQRQAAAEQAAQRRQGELLEQKLCTTLGRLAALKPPPGNPADNPSRAFDQKLYLTLNELAPDLGCAGSPAVSPSPPSGH